MESLYQVDQISSEGIAQFAYVITSEGESVVIDPPRDWSLINSTVTSRSAKIRYVYLTHMHADFVAGHASLQQASGAELIVAKGSAFSGQFKAVEDGEVLPLGKVELKILATPGHTLDSSCLLLVENGKNKATFTGDTVFLGEVGRPDLSVDPAITPEKLAGLLYDSVQKIKALADDVVLYPGHGAGSACGKSIAPGKSSTVGEQKSTNYALKAETKEEFVAKITEKLPPPAPYFFNSVELNLNSKLESAEEFAKNKKKFLNSKEFEAASKTEGVFLIDSRPSEEFRKSSIPGSLSFPLLKFEYFVTIYLLPIHRLLFIAPQGTEDLILKKLALLGYHNFEGFLEGGFDSWTGPKQPVRTISVEDFIKKELGPDESPLDVRSVPETSTFVRGAVFLPTIKLIQDAEKLDKCKTYYAYCQMGGRALSTTSYLLGKGVNVIAVNPGFAEIGKHPEIVDKRE